MPTSVTCLLASKSELANEGPCTTPVLPSTFIHKSVLKHRHSHFLNVLSVAALMLQWQIWVVVTEMAWITKPKNIYYLAFYRNSLPTLNQHFRTLLPIIGLVLACLILTICNLGVFFNVTLKNEHYVCYQLSSWLSMKRLIWETKDRHGNGNQRSGHRHPHLAEGPLCLGTATAQDTGQHARGLPCSAGPCDQLTSAQEGLGCC